MSDYITYRETIEYTVRVPRDDQETYGEETRLDVKVLSKEEIGRRHEPDYGLDCDLKAELYHLLEDDARIFHSRSHDAVLDHATSLGVDVSGAFRFGDIEDPSKSWRIISESKASVAKKETTAAREPGALWEALTDGAAPVDESVTITSSDINQQTAANMSRWPE